MIFTSREDETAGLPSDPLGLGSLPDKVCILFSIYINFINFVYQGDQASNKAKFSTVGLNHNRVYVQLVMSLVTILVTYCTCTGPIFVSIVVRAQVIRFVGTGCWYTPVEYWAHEDGYKQPAFKLKLY